VRNNDVKKCLELSGYEVIKLGDENCELSAAISDFDVIFNTVPYVLFTENVLEHAKHKPLYIEIASSPGGIDVSAARRADIQTIFAPSLPGKYAPVSAGEYIFETISEVLKERSIYL
jgi:dipicolinate synthase subunit A